MSLLIELMPLAGPALVVGGGAVARRKIEGLLEGGFSVTVIAPEITPATPDERLQLVRREFREGDVEGYVLVFACTNRRAVNRRVGEAARRRGIFVVVADSQGESTFFSPAVHRDGDLAVAVSTHGSSPGLARDVRDLIARQLGPGWADRVVQAGRRRGKASRAGEDETDGKPDDGGAGGG